MKIYLTPCAKLVKPLQSIHGAAHIAEPLAPPARALQWLMGDAACTAAKVANKFAIQAGGA